MLTEEVAAIWQQTGLDPVAVVALGLVLAPEVAVGVGSKTPALKMLDPAGVVALGLVVTPEVVVGVGVTTAPMAWPP